MLNDFSAEELAKDRASLHAQARRVAVKLIFQKHAEVALQWGPLASSSG
jgi:hypothetical protein